MPKVSKKIFYYGETMMELHIEYNSTDKFFVRIPLELKDSAEDIRFRQPLPSQYGLKHLKKSLEVVCSGETEDVCVKNMTALLRYIHGATKVSRDVILIFTSTETVDVKNIVRYVDFEQEPTGIVLGFAYAEEHSSSIGDKVYYQKSRTGGLSKITANLGNFSVVPDTEANREVLSDIRSRLEALSNTLQSILRSNGYLEKLLLALPPNESE